MQCNIMPARKTPLVTGEIYHVFNRGIAKQPTFTDLREHKRAIKIIDYYRLDSPPVKLSRYLTLPKDAQDLVTSRLQDLSELVEIYAFCLMPNHFHFLLKQIASNGISRFLAQFQNSYTRYFNTKHERDGALFLDQFKSVRVESEEQLTHVSRYIHLNPYSSFVVKTIEDTLNYPWSSLPEYISGQSKFCCTDLVLSQFKDRESYKSFVLDRADYQKKLEIIKHLLIEDR